MSIDVNKNFYREGDEYEIVDLLKLCFDEWKLYEDPVSYWKWKWIDSPNSSTIVIVRQNEKLVAVSHRIYPETKIGNSILKIGYGDDFATHPDFRGKGFFKELQDITEDEGKKRHGCKIILSVNTNPITIKNNLKRGRLLLPHKIEHMVFINNPNLHFKKINLKYNYVYSIGFRFLKIFNSLRNIIKSEKHGSNNAFKVIQITNFDDKYDDFWDKIKEDYLFISVKNSHFLNWRYSDKRGGDNKIYEITGNGNVLGFMVLEIRDNNGYKTGYILELLSLKDREDIKFYLVQHLKNEMTKMGVNILNFKTTEYRMINLLEQKGFIKMPFTKEFKAMYEFIDSDIEKEIFLTTKPDEVYWGYGNYFQ